MTNMSSAAAKALEAFGGTILFAEELTANEGQSHAIEGLDTEKSVRDLRHCISRAINDKPSWSTMQVIFAGEVMDDMTKRLSHYGVHNGDTVYFIRSITEAPPPYDAEPDAMPSSSSAAKPSSLKSTLAIREAAVPSASSASASNSTRSTPQLKTLFFRDLDGKSLALSDVSIDTKMSDVFQRLGREKALDIEWLRFIWSGKQLGGDKTIRDYGIMNESTIHIVARLRGGQ
ncbi:hypothetical protein SEUCBS139899_009167 [Sporothrix eucalyptigena]